VREAEAAPSGATGDLLDAEQLTPNEERRRSAPNGARNGRVTA
jgi:hypothetical protein